MASRYSRGGRGGRVKKKHSFLTKARKYASKGLYGRGKNIDEETYNYFVRVMERLKDEFEDEEEKGTFCFSLKTSQFTVNYIATQKCLSSTFSNRPKEKKWI